MRISSDSTFFCEILRVYLFLSLRFLRIGLLDSGSLLPQDASEHFIP